MVFIIERENVITQAILGIVVAILIMIGIFAGVILLMDSAIRDILN